MTCHGLISLGTGDICINAVLRFFATAATLPCSASRGMATICSSVKRLFLIGSSFLSKSHLSRYQCSEKVGRLVWALLSERLSQRLIPNSANDRARLPARRIFDRPLDSDRSDRLANPEGHPGSRCDPKRRSPNPSGGEDSSDNSEKTWADVVTAIAVRHGKFRRRTYAHQLAGGRETFDPLRFGEVVLIQLAVMSPLLRLDRAWG